MCGIAGLFGPWARGAAGEARLAAMVAAQAHRGPDGFGAWSDPESVVRLGHNRLAIIDLSPAGAQPLAWQGRYRLSFNGEIYNYRELRRELEGRCDFRTGTDTEVLLAAYHHWGVACLDRLVGMFAFALWDEAEGKLFAARDRFGVKPFYYHHGAEGLLFASEIKALHAAGLPREPDAATWATYLAHGRYDHGEATFWHGVRRLPPGGFLRAGADGRVEVGRWYDLGERVAAAGPDERDDAAVAAEVAELLDETVRYRLVADVEIGVCLSGGLDSSLLLALLRRRLGDDLGMRSYSFYCGDPAYDELPWIETLLEGGRLRASFCLLDAAEVPDLALAAARAQDAPYGGLPTLAMGKIFARARVDGLKVLLDGNGMDEAWAGYDHYARPASESPIQGSRGPATFATAVRPELAALAEEPAPVGVALDSLALAQLRDLTLAKIPRTQRFADHMAMAHGIELREPFLHHPLVELGLRQPAHRKIRDGEGKWLIRRVAEGLLPAAVRQAPKRPVQTPQREWLRGPLAPWADDLIETALRRHAGWLDAAEVRARWQAFRQCDGDNSFPIWQWLSVALHT